MLIYHKYEKWFLLRIPTAYVFWYKEKHYDNFKILHHTAKLFDRKLWPIGKYLQFEV